MKRSNQNKIDSLILRFENVKSRIILVAFLCFVFILSIAKYCNANSLFKTVFYQNYQQEDSSKILNLLINYQNAFTRVGEEVKVKIFQENVLIKEVSSDVNGRLKVILNSGHQFHIIAIFKGYPVGLVVDTREVISNPSKKGYGYRFDCLINYDIIKPDKSSNLIFYKANIAFNSIYKKFEVKEELNRFKDISNLSDYKGNKLNFKIETIEKKGKIAFERGKTVTYLLIKARDGNKTFHKCKTINNGKVIYSGSSDHVDSALISIDGYKNMEIVTVCDAVQDRAFELIIDCPGFFKKKIICDFYALYHKFKFSQSSPDTINILLDSCYLADRSASYYSGNYYYSSNGKLERIKKLNNWEIESTNMYKDMVERAKNSRNAYYKSNPLIQNASSGLNINNTDTNNSVKENFYEMNEGNLKQTEELQLIANNVIDEMDSMDNEIRAIGKIDEVIFKRQASNLLPVTTKKKFEKFGFDTLKIYAERKVRQKLQLLEKRTAKLKNATDTLSLYAELYRINKDFIYIGKKRIEELSSDTGNRLLIAEIKKGVYEKEMENYFIKKEVNDLRQKLKNKTLELQNERNKFLFVLILLITFIGFSVVLFKQNKKVKELNCLLTININEIKESIHYSKRIQEAMLPPLSEIKLAFPQSFILFKPKDIVSGDFYWFQEVENKKFIAACDCTGHGVPGALMSMVATDMLNDALVHTKNVDEILSFTNRSIKTALKQSIDDDSTRDGMDIALCCFDDQANMLKYTGAYRPLWIIRLHTEQNETSKARYELLEYKATKAAIGGLTDDKQTFQLNEIQLQKGDTIYLSSDGFADQFSPADKKLMTKRFKEILLGIQHLTMPEQGNYLDNFITEWRGNMEQTDDILVIGVRV
ncbi:MAG TPA: SpoIIE family protein phosphatase [Bacteroidia bacterium]|nr:SpoIIE family protein phosphatase [Bacteroidia bacterium]